MKNKWLVDYIKGGNLQRDSKGRFYYIVPTSVRRSGCKIIPESTINKLIKDGLLTKEDLNK